MPRPGGVTVITAEAGSRPRTWAAGASGREVPVPPGALRCRYPQAAGTRMVERLGDGDIRLETLEVIETPAAIHTRFRVLR